MNIIIAGYIQNENRNLMIINNLENLVENLYNEIDELRIRPRPVIPDPVIPRPDPVIPRPNPVIPNIPDNSEEIRKLNSLIGD